MMSRFFFTPQPPDQVDPATAQQTADRLLPFILRAVNAEGPPRGEGAR
jgi:hypothetical protein